MMLTMMRAFVHRVRVWSLKPKFSVSNQMVALANFYVSSTVITM